MKGLWLGRRSALTGVRRTGRPGGG
ncbi:protein of unknown function [Azospirillum baldaniorum]|uniref:Uncharacterized protein n=1 Tax=Azospirillum baldaniorum TaxID=1064539 RepID=A0A9P1NMG3_9PROT|nr:protein of unknown function [Azospirillum baldaniorum]